MAQKQNHLVTGSKKTTRTTESEVGKGRGKGEEAEKLNI
jgi:hypothetical protein